jgi:hypothetical protein
MKMIVCFSLIIVLISCAEHYATTEENKVVVEKPGTFERGKNLAFNICGQCHYDASLGRFSGKKMEDLPSFIGPVYSSNLTHSSTYGVLEKYSDAEVMHLLKTGVNRDGKYVPYMIRPNIAEEDMNDILAYFRSHDSAVKATESIAGETDLNIIGKLGTKIEGKPLDYKKGITRPDENNAIEYGRYLVDNLACYHCHSKNILGLDYLEPEKSKGYLEGGMKFKTPEGNKVFSANLTPDNETGIGKYTKESFRKALTKGINQVGDSIRYPMQKFPHLTNKQSDAILAYLKSLAPVKHDVKN